MAAQTPSQPPPIVVGCAGFGGPVSPYLRRLAAVEYQQTFIYPPRSAVLGRLRQQAPAPFVFSLRAWQLITHPASSPSYRRLPKPLAGPKTDYGSFLPTAAVAEAWSRTLAAAELLEARAIVFETPASFTPSARHRGLLSAFFEALPRDERWLVWQPRGLWSSAEVHRVCADLDLVPGWEPREDQQVPGGARGYLRVSGLGAGGSFELSRCHELAQMLLGFDQAFCIVSTPQMFFDAQRLNQAVQQLLGLDRDDDEDFDDEDFDDEDFDDEDSDFKRDDEEFDDLDGELDPEPERD